MKFVLSPAKSLDFKTKVPTVRPTEGLFLKEAEVINSTLRGKKPEDLKILMRISDNLAELNWQRNQEWSLPFDEDNARPAGFTFNGDVYAGLDAFTLKRDQIAYFQKNVRILSGQYGLLKPLDLIQAYRLEMGTKLEVNGSVNLYDFWKSKITNALREELNDEEPLINLASNEYFKAIDTKALERKVVSPVFKDYKNGKLKVISFYAKKARGLMVRYAIDSKAQYPEDLLSFDYDGYAFSEEHSTPDTPTFIR